MINVLIADDEPPARRRLQQLLDRYDEVRVVGEAADGAEAVAAIQESKPDVLLLDVQMPHLNGFEVLRYIGSTHMPLTIFVTAYDRYAIDAFEANAIDYLLKPVQADRFHKSWLRMRDRLSQRTASSEPLHRLATHLRGPQYLDRIVIREVSRVRIIPVTEILYIESANNYARVHTAAGVYYARTPLKQLEAQLDPQNFVRVHRTAIVAVNQVIGLERISHGDSRLMLRNGSTVTASRTYLAGIQKHFIRE
jgi:two-component system, LytTR family, response regulator